MEKNKNTQAIIVILLVVLLIGVLVFLGVKYFSNQNELPAQNNQTNGTGELTKSFDEKFLDYLVDMVVEGAKNNVLLKDTEGNIDADKLTEQEAISNKAQYRRTLENNLSNRDIFSDKFIKGQKQSITFKMEAVLNLLGLGTHMGAGMGATDFDGMQLYSEGDSAKINSDYTVFEEFGYNMDTFVESVFIKIKNYAKAGSLLKDTEGNVTADKVTEAEVESNKKTIIETIEMYIGGRESIKVWKDNTLQVTYDMEALLNEFGWGSHMGAGLGVDKDGNITETL